MSVDAFRPPEHDEVVTSLRVHSVALSGEEREEVDKRAAEREAERERAGAGKYQARRDAVEAIKAEDGQPAELGEIPTYPVAALPRAAREMVESAELAGLPAALAAGAALAALATSIGPGTSIEAMPQWVERAILWFALLAPRGAGKSPCQQLAFLPVRQRDEKLWETYQEELRDWRSTQAKERGPKPIDPTVLSADTTLEALVRRLDESHGLGLDLDELSLLLRGIGEYKSRGGGDQGRFLSLWTGAPTRYTRVGANSGGANGIDLLIARPTLVICGGLQPPLHGLLGGEEDGLRPRWLPHLAAMPDHDPSGSAGTPYSWRRLLGHALLPARAEVRSWTLSPAAREVFRTIQRIWKREARGCESASVSAALIKADIHLLRIVLTFAEAEAPAAGGQVTVALIERAIAVVEYVIACWRALPEADGLALSEKDAKLDRAVERIRDWLEQHGGQATRRQLLLGSVGGVRTAGDLAQVLARYEARYPGCVIETKPGPAGGRPGLAVMAPRRVRHEGDSPRGLLAANKPRERNSSPPEASREYGSAIPEGDDEAMLAANKPLPTNPDANKPADNAGPADAAWLASLDESRPTDPEEVEG